MIDKAIIIKIIIILILSLLLLYQDNRCLLMGMPDVTMNIRHMIREVRLGRVMALAMVSPALIPHYIGLYTVEDAHVCDQVGL